MCVCMCVCLVSCTSLIMECSPRITISGIGCWSFAYQVLVTYRMAIAVVVDAGRDCMCRLLIVFVWDADRV